MTTKCQESDIRTSNQLVNLINESKEYITQPEPRVIVKTFQALRIYVNNELSSLKLMLKNLDFISKPKTLCVVITFHNLESKIVDDFLIRNSEIYKTIVKGLVPSKIEIENNNASRSGLLFAFFKK